jgi:hypothetical protein
VKYNSDGSVASVDLVETKFSTSGNASLSNTQTMGQQMSDQWINANITKMLDSGNPELVQTANLIQNNRSLVTRQLNVVVPNGTSVWSSIP